MLSKWIMEHAPIEIIPSQTQTTKLHANFLCAGGVVGHHDGLVSNLEPCIVPVGSRGRGPLNSGGGSR